MFFLRAGPHQVLAGPGGVLERHRLAKQRFGGGEGRALILFSLIIIPPNTKQSWNNRRTKKFEKRNHNRPKFTAHSPEKSLNSQLALAGGLEADQVPHLGLKKHFLKEKYFLYNLWEIPAGSQLSSLGMRSRPSASPSPPRPPGSWRP